MFETPRKSRRTPKPSNEVDEDGLLPVTIRIIQDAMEKSVEDGIIYFHDTKPLALLLVGQIMHLCEIPNGIQLLLDDASGCMELQYPCEKDWLRQNWLQRGQYVHVTVKCGLKPTKHVNVIDMRPVVNGDAISYHTIEVAHAALKLRAASQPLHR